MSRSWFKFGDLDTRDYGIAVTAKDRYALPVRDYTEHEIIGRNGSIFTDNGRYKNVSIKYHCELPTEKWLGFGEKFDEFRYRLARLTGYQELVDSYDENKIRRGVLAASVTPESNGPAWIIGAFDVEFSCEPQIYTTKGQERKNIGSVVMGAIAGCEKSVKPSEPDGSVLRESSIYCRTNGIVVTPGSILSVSTTNTEKDSVTVFIAQFDTNASVVQDAMIKSEWKAVKKGETLNYQTESTTKVVRLCWVASTLNTTDESDPQIMTLECSAGTFRYGTNRIFYDFSGEFETSPEIGIWSYGTYDEAKIAMDGVTMKIGRRTDGSTDKIICDCEKEIFKDPNGKSVNKICGVFANEDCTKISAVFPQLRPGMNSIKILWPTRDKYDPLYYFYLTTREYVI